MRVGFGQFWWDAFAREPQEYEQQRQRRRTTGRKKQAERLGLSLMSRKNESKFDTAFTQSIEARSGVTTGISASDRSITIKTAINDSPYL